MESEEIAPRVLVGWMGAVIAVGSGPGGGGQCALVGGGIFHQGLVGDVEDGLEDEVGGSSRLGEAPRHRCHC